MINVTFQKPGSAKKPGRPRKSFSEPGEGFLLGKGAMLECNEGKCYATNDKNTQVDFTTRNIQIMPSALKKDGIVIGKTSFAFFEDGTKCAIWADVRPGKESSHVVCASKDYFKSPEWKPIRTVDE